MPAARLAVAPRVFCDPKPKATSACGDALPRRVKIWITPPLALAPYRAERLPRTTSMRSIASVESCESEARPVFSAVFDMPPERAFAFAAAELRLPAETEPRDLGMGLSQAAAMTSACPGLALDANLLPESQRRSSSKLRYIPTGVLAVVLAGLCSLLVLHQPYDERVYREALEAELKATEPLSSRVGNLDKNTEKTRKRVVQLDDFRKRTRADLDLVLELTGTFQPPSFLSGLDLARDNVTITGEAEQAAPLLRVLDDSPRLAGSEFITPIGRLAASEVFRIRSQRETPPPPATPPAVSGAPKQ